MTASDDTGLISLDPPYRLGDDDDTFEFRGWAQIEDEAHPDVCLHINGVAAPVARRVLPAFEIKFPGVKAVGLTATVRFADLLPTPPEEPFLLTATVTSGRWSRTFEYEVSEGWTRRVFGRAVKRRRIPPEHLQFRIAGSASGWYHGSGRVVADRIVAILAGAGHPIGGFRTILDFGCGPGRILPSIRELAPRARLFGSDIDAEAIGWASGALGDVASFCANDTEPPLPFPDETFDLIYSISIFTHLPEDMQWRWLAELRRVLKPGGILLTTTLDPGEYDLPEAVKADGAARGFAYMGDAFLPEGMPDFYRLAYHTHDYIRERWSAYFEVLSIGSHDLNYSQDSVLLRRPRHAFSWLPSGVRKRLHRLARLGARMGGPRDSEPLAAG